MNKNTEYILDPNDESDVINVTTILKQEEEIKELKLALHECYNSICFKQPDPLAGPKNGLIVKKINLDIINTFLYKIFGTKVRVLHFGKFILHNVDLKNTNIGPLSPLYKEISVLIITRHSEDDNEKSYLSLIYDSILVDGTTQKYRLDYIVITKDGKILNINDTDFERGIL